MGLGRTLKVLNGMVADDVIRRYAVAGAIAATRYLEPMSTDDVDILVSFNSDSPLVTLKPIVEYLAAKGYTEWRKEGLLVEGWPVQFLPVADSLDQEALDQAEKVDEDFREEGVVPVWFMRPEHLVATAVRTKRHKDYLRVNAFLEEGAVDLDKLRDVVTRHRLEADWALFCQKSGRRDPLDKKCDP